MIMKSQKNLISCRSKEELVGSVGWVHQYVDMSKEVVTLDDGTNVTTCKPGMGYRSVLDLIYIFLSKSITAYVLLLFF